MSPEKNTVGEVDKVDEVAPPTSSTSLPSPTSRRVSPTPHPRRTDRLRPLNVPRRVAVVLGVDGLPEEVGEMDEVHAPQSLPASSTWFTSPASRRVESIGEIWRIDDEWWRTPINRRYVEVTLEGGGHVVLYEDLNTNEWFMQKI